MIESENFGGGEGQQPMIQTYNLILIRKMECQRSPRAFPESTWEPNFRTKNIHPLSFLPLVGNF